MHELTPRVIQLMKSAIKLSDSQEIVARAIGIDKSLLCKYISGRVKSVQTDTWNKLCDYFPEIDDRKKALHSECEMVTGAMPTYPVISMAAAVEASGMVYMPIDEYAELNAEQRLSFSAGQPGDFVIRVSGDSMLPWYPPGTHILVRPGSSVKTGNRCVAILADGEVVFKVFVERKTTWLLAAINGDGGKNYVFKKGDVKSVRGIYRVIQSMRTEEDLDKAMQEAGQHHFWEMLLDEDRDGENGLKPNGVENEGDLPKVQG